MITLIFSFFAYWIEKRGSRKHLANVYWTINSFFAVQFIFRNPLIIYPYILSFASIYKFYTCNDEQTFSLQLAYHCCIFIRDLPCLIIATWCVSWSYFIRGCTRVIKVSGLQTEIVARRFSSRGRSSRRCGIVARGSFVDRGLGETVRSDRRWVSTGSIWFYFHGGREKNDTHTQIDACFLSCYRYGQEIQSHGKVVACRRGVSRSFVQRERIVRTAPGAKLSRISRCHLSSARGSLCGHFWTLPEGELILIRVLLSIRTFNLQKNQSVFRDLRFFTSHSNLCQQRRTLPTCISNFYKNFPNFYLARDASIPSLSLEVSLTVSYTDSRALLIDRFVIYRKLWLVAWVERWQHSKRAALFKFARHLLLRARCLSPSVSQLRSTLPTCVTFREREFQMIAHAKISLSKHIPRLPPKILLNPTKKKEKKEEKKKILSTFLGI